MNKGEVVLRHYVWENFCWMGFVRELMALEVEDKLRGFLWVKPT